MGPFGVPRSLSKYSSAPRWVQAGCTSRKGPKGDVVASFKGPDAAGSPPGPLPKGVRRRASPCCVRLGLRSTRYAHLAFLAWLARRRTRGAFQLLGQAPSHVWPDREPVIHRGPDGACVGRPQGFRAVQVPGGHLNYPSSLEMRGHGPVDGGWREPVLGGQEAEAGGSG